MLLKKETWKSIVSKDNCIAGNEFKCMVNSQDIYAVVLNVYYLAYNSNLTCSVQISYLILDLQI